MANTDGKGAQNWTYHLFGSIWQEIEDIKTVQKDIARSVARLHDDVVGLRDYMVDFRKAASTQAAANVQAGRDSPPSYGDGGDLLVQQQEIKDEYSNATERLARLIARIRSASGDVGQATDQEADDCLPLGNRNRHEDPKRRTRPMPPIVRPLASDNEEEPE